jgi:hypothetical protein
VLKLLRHLLCLGLLLGLAGNGIAVAAPCVLMQSQTATMADMPDCAMAQPSTPDHHKQKGKAPGCMATVACAAMLAMKEPAATVTPSGPTTVAKFWPAPAKLAGRDVAPDPEPPALLG